VITVESVSKTYGRFGRKTRALDGVSLEVRRGETLGLIGPNGAGKTTLLSCLLGFLRPDSGSLAIEGRPVDDLWVRARTGYMPERLGFDRDLSGAAFLAVHWRLCGGDPAHARAEIQAAADRVGLDRSALGKKLRTYSRGMLQRIGMAQATLRNPALIRLSLHCGSPRSSPPGGAHLLAPPRGPPPPTSLHSGADAQLPSATTLVFASSTMPR